MSTTMHAVPVPGVDFALAFAVIALAAALQGVIGMGFNVVSVPVLLIINPVLAPVPNLLISVPLSVAAAVRERGHIDVGGVGWIMAGRVPGTLAGFGLILIASDRVLELSIALIVLAMVVILAGGFSVRRTPMLEVGAGAFSGVASIVASMGGPPIALLYRGERGPIIRSTLAVMFTLGIVFAIVVRAAGDLIAGSDVTIALLLLPAVALGFAASSRIKGSVSDDAIRRGILVSSAAAGLVVMFRALFA